MDSEYGGDFISVTDEDGNEFELELLDALIHNDIEYYAFVTAATGENQEDLEIIILKAVEEDGEEQLSTLDDDAELEAVYALFMERFTEAEADAD